MGVRHVTAAAAAALALTAGVAPVAFAGAPAATPAALPRCAELDLTVRAEPSDATDGVLMLSVRNDTAKDCVVDRVPTVTYGELDGAALPVPAVPHGGRTLGAHDTVYAAVRSLSDSDDAAEQARVVTSVRVAASPDQDGRAFQALTLGAPAGLEVWEPVTTQWQPSATRAEEVLHAEVTGRGSYAA
ncbi:DUF4232 domain-containing protein [Streptomyces sp. SID8379]|uniref:DUF4232 domain-containing protein n=1 Tax=unclassified Streptomyces TaxID=2593676 RepID=UPI000379289D|nr:MULTISPECIES: DUF4232 domain-containing protein [unclassified Streptomyces]MYW66980.1 DUF4232 domain-containing protein [Streptomyces sp. SID8379]